MNNDVQQKNVAIRDCCAEVNWDVLHAQELLSEAVNRLIEETLALQDGCDALFREEPLRQFEGTTEQASEKAREQHEKLLSMRRMVTERTSASLLQLQFQDMATQVLEHAKKGLQRLMNMALNAEAHGPSDGLDEAVPAPDAGGGVRKKPVMSRDMQAGDVDFF